MFISHKFKNKLEFLEHHKTLTSNAPKILYNKVGPKFFLLENEKNEGVSAFNYCGGTA
jgi:hypothetical protein